MAPNWKTDGWKYTAEMFGVFDTRHEAVGAAAVDARVAREKYGERHPPTVMESTRRVYAFKPFRCGYCSETFLTQDEHDEHQPCPMWQKDKPLSPEGGSNPIEAARMTRYNL